MSSSLMGWNWKIWLRETSGELTAKKGFSVVAPTRRIKTRFDDLLKVMSCWGAVEAVDFIEEEDGSLAGGAEAVFGGFENGADFLHARAGGVELLEMAFAVVGDELRQRRLSSAGRAVEDDAVDPIGLEHPAEEFSGAEKSVAGRQIRREPRGRMRTARGATRSVFFLRELAKRSLIGVNLHVGILDCGFWIGDGELAVRPAHHALGSFFLGVISFWGLDLKVAVGSFVLNGFCEGVRGESGSSEYLRHRRLRRVESDDVVSVKRILGNEFIGMILRAKGENVGGKNGMRDENIKLYWERIGW